MKRTRGQKQGGKRPRPAQKPIKAGPQDVGPDGVPTDPSHRWNKPTGQSGRARLICREMWKCERAWRAGSLHAVLDAVAFCHERNIAPPSWLVIAVETLVARQLLVKSGRGRFNSRQAVFRKNQKHYARWDMVRELRDQGRELHESTRDDRGLSLEKAHAAVSEKLRKTAVKGREGTIKRSYDIVEGRLAKGGGAEFYTPRFKPRVKRD